MKFRRFIILERYGGTHKNGHIVICLSNYSLAESFFSKAYFSCLDIYFSLDQFIIGDGNNLYDFTYVENVAHAHVCAERALASEGIVAEKASGQVL